MRSVMRPINRNGCQKSPMEDFLFILTISLAVAVNYFATKTLADRFVLAEKSADARSIPMEQYQELSVVELPEQPIIIFAGVEFGSASDLDQYLDQNPTSETEILLRAEKSRSLGDFEDTKHVFLKRDIKVFTEWEQRNE